jgi:hypothetical protein
VLALGAYGFVATFQPDPNFVRILAAYGGVFVAGSLVWGIAVDKFAGPVGHHRRHHLPARRRRDHVRVARRCRLLTVNKPWFAEDRPVFRRVSGPTQLQKLLQKGPSVH